MAEGALVKFAGPAAPDVEQNQAQRAPDRRVGAVARAESIAVAIHPDLVRDRPVDDQQRCCHVRRRLDPV